MLWLTSISSPSGLLQLIPTALPELWALAPTALASSTFQNHSVLLSPKLGSGDKSRESPPGGACGTGQWGEAACRTPPPWSNSSWGKAGTLFGKACGQCRNCRRRGVGEEPTGFSERKRVSRLTVLLPVSWSQTNPLPLLFPRKKCYFISEHLQPSRLHRFPTGFAICLTLEIRPSLPGPPWLERTVPVVMAGPRTRGHLSSQRRRAGTEAGRWGSPPSLHRPAHTGHTRTHTRHGRSHRPP